MENFNKQAQQKNILLEMKQEANKMVKRIIWTLLTIVSQKENKGVEEILEEMKTEFNYSGIHKSRIFQSYSLSDFTDFNKSENHNLIRKHNQDVMREKCLKRSIPSLPDGALRIGH